MKAKPLINRQQLREIEARMKAFAFGNGGVRLGVALPERQFQEQVRELAKWTGWMIYHTHNSTHSPAGFPDLVLARSPRLIFAELKNDVGRQSDEQTHWLDELRGVAGVETYVWRPSDLDEIQRILAKVTR
jgi:hypothetical protein